MSPLAEFLLDSIVGSAMPSRENQCLFCSLPRVLPVLLWSGDLRTFVQKQQDCNRNDPGIISDWFLQPVPCAFELTCSSLEPTQPVALLVVSTPQPEVADHQILQHLSHSFKFRIFSLGFSRFKRGQWRLSQHPTQH